MNNEHIEKKRVLTKDNSAVSLSPIQGTERHPTGTIQLWAHSDVFREEMEALGLSDISQLDSASCVEMEVAEAINVAEMLIAVIAELDADESQVEQVLQLTTGHGVPIDKDGVDYDRYSSQTIWNNDRYQQAHVQVDLGPAFDLKFGDRVDVWVIIRRA